MKKLIYTTSLIASLFIVGCGSEEERAPQQVVQPSVPSVSAYRTLLEKRAASVDGANINVRQEVGKYENASDEEKRELYSKVESLVR